MQMIFDIMQLLNENRHIEQPTLVPSILCWILAPIDRIINQNWRELKAFIPKEWIVDISNGTKTMELIGGCVIECRSAYDTQSLVGVGVDFCSITEAARVKDLKTVMRNIEARLKSPGRGIGGKGGRLVVNSSPLGKNFFYNIWTWGQRSHPNFDSNWISYQLPSWENPEIDKEFKQPVKTKTGEVISYKESLYRRYGKEARQDFGAEFLESGGTVFSNFKERCVHDVYEANLGKTKEELRKEIQDLQKPKVATMYRVGYDPASGSSGDMPVLVIREMSTDNIVRAIDMYGKIDDDQLDEVAFWAKSYNNAEICVLTLGNMLVEGQLRKRGCNVTPIGEQGTQKRMLVQSLQRAVQNEDIMVIDDGSTEIQSLIFQMEDYTESEKTGKFSNSNEANDDYVSALYATYYDYSSVPEFKAHYTGMVAGVNSKARRKA